LDLATTSRLLRAATEHFVGRSRQLQDLHAAVGNQSWLSLIATIRAAMQSWQQADMLTTIALDGLDPDDALALLREWQPGNVFRDQGDEAGAKALLRWLEHRRLLTPAVAPELRRMHRLVQVHLRAKSAADVGAQVDAGVDTEQAQLEQQMHHRTTAPWRSVIPSCGRSPPSAKWRFTTHGRSTKFSPHYRRTTCIFRQRISRFGNMSSSG